jgi:hypothetical protein
MVFSLLGMHTEMPGEEIESQSKISSKERLFVRIGVQVRYGAEMVFSSSALNITDEDIDAIIQKGERDTAALNNKLKVRFCQSLRVGLFLSLSCSRAARPPTLFFGCGVCGAQRGSQRWDGTTHCRHDSSDDSSLASMAQHASPGAFAFTLGGMPPTYHDSLADSSLLLPAGVHRERHEVHAGRRHQRVRV